LKKVHCCQHIIDLTNTVIVRAPTLASASEVESQTYQASLTQPLFQGPYHVVVHISAEHRVRMAEHDSRGRIVTGVRCLEDPFER
jgi:hypothetical protein